MSSFFLQVNFLHNQFLTKQETDILPLLFVYIRTSPNWIQLQNAAFS